jgi:ankyrin repeat protein
MFVLCSIAFGDEKNTPLIDALWNRNKREVLNLLEKRENPDQKNEYGIPALTLALKFNDSSVIKSFIEHGADVNIQDNNGFSTLIVASMQKQYAICELLLKNGADVDKKHNGGFTALMLAAQNNDPKMVTLLLENGALIDIDRPQGGTALGFAADRGNLAIVKILLANKANIDFADTVGGYTPLMIAVYMKRYETVDYLLKMGSNKDIKNKDGLTVYDFARQINDRRINRLLGL